MYKDPCECNDTEITCIEHGCGICFNNRFTCSSPKTENIVLPNYIWDNDFYNWSFYLSLWLEIPKKVSGKRNLISKWNNTLDDFLWSLYYENDNIYFGCYMDNVWNPYIIQLPVFYNKKYNIEITLSWIDASQIGSFGHVNGLCFDSSEFIDIIPTNDDYGPICLLCNEINDTHLSMNAFIDDIIISDILPYTYYHNGAEDHLINDLVVLNPLKYRHIYYMNEILTTGSLYMLKDSGSEPANFTFQATILPEVQCGRVLIPCSRISNSSGGTFPYDLYGAGFAIVNKTTIRHTPGLGYIIFDEKPKKVIVQERIGESIVQTVNLKIQELVTDKKWTSFYCFGTTNATLYIVIVLYENGKTEHYNVIVRN